MTIRAARMSVLLSAMGIERWESRSSKTTHPNDAFDSAPVASTADESAAPVGQAVRSRTKSSSANTLDVAEPKEIHMNTPQAADARFGSVQLALWRTVRSLIFAPNSSSLPPRLLSDLKRAVDGSAASDQLDVLPVFSWPPPGTRGLAQTASMVSALRALIQRADTQSPLRVVLMFRGAGDAAFEELTESGFVFSSSGNDGSDAGARVRSIKALLLPPVADVLASAECKRALWKQLTDP